MQPITTALCSFGMSGKVFHAPFLHLHPGFNLYAIWERKSGTAKEKYPDVIIYRSLEELLRDEKIELVIVNTPNYTHYEYAQKALLAGKQVVVEKPFTVTVEEGNALIQLAAEKKKILSVFQNRRWDSDFKTVKKIADEKWLGDIVEAEIHFDRFNESLSSKTHKETPGPGAGLLYDLGSHLIDQALQLFGMPKAVFADLHIMRPISKVEDYMELLLIYPRTRVRLRASYLVREPIPSFVIHGFKGSFIKSRADVQEAMLMAGADPVGPEWGKEPDTERGLLHTEKDGKIIRERVPSLPGNYMEYYNLLYDAIRNNGPVPVRANDGLNVIRTIEVAIKSTKEKKLMPWM